VAPGRTGAAPETLAASLGTVLPSLPRELVGDTAVEALMRMAGTLAPIHCAGFEVRLDEDPTVDLVQRIAATRGEPDRLGRHIEATGLDRHPVWRRVAALCRAWSSPQSLAHRSVLAAFLGFDAATAGAAQPIPSLYLSLEPGAGVQQDLADLIGDTATMLRGAPLSPATMAAVAACRDALPAGAAVADLGFMLARPVDALRLVVARMPRGAAAGYLSGLPWVGPPPDVTSAEALLPADLQHVILSLDVAAGVLPRVGFECDPGYAEADLPNWVEALDALTGGGLCNGPKRDALLRWPGHIEPVDVDHRWPGCLLQESLLNRSDQFLVLARRLTFLKLVCDQHGVQQAKAYFGYGPRSFVPGASPQGLPGPPTRSAGGLLENVVAGGERRSRPGAGSAMSGADVSAATLQAAAQRAARFLLERRGADGLWLEFPRVLRGTDEWVTAYLADALAGLRDERCLGAAASAWQALCARRGATDGWGYNADLPVDADSTLWGLRLAAALGRGQEPRARAARRVLEAHRVPDGVATYAPAAEPGLRRLLGDADLRGIFAAHTCVTAAAAAPEALGAGIAATLRKRQEPDGRWRGYWWSDDEYATWLAVDALARGPTAGSEEALRRAGRWALRRFERARVVWSRELAAPSSFAGALCLAIMIASGAARSEDAGEHTALRALAALLEAQQPDGGWPAAALMRMPPPEEADGDARPAETAVSADDRRLFTTATVLRALTAARRGLQATQASSRPASRPAAP
jgi:hypothetical protein